VTSNAQSAASLPTHLVVMGVSGCGKSTIGELLADRLGWPFRDADDLHPAANVAKMSAGVPLDDDDRGPWLAAIRDELSASSDAGQSSVLACSALRRAYRDVLATAHGRVRFIHLDLPDDVISARVAARESHFRPASLVSSQFASLERLGVDEDGVVIPLEGAPADMVDAALDALTG
jgi:gluconokinase